jgi:spore germination cell wall hydrolase CwlJ-like protein
LLARRYLVLNQIVRGFVQTLMSKRAHGARTAVLAGSKTLIMRATRKIRLRTLTDPRALACGILALAFITAMIGLLDPGTTSARTILPGLVDEARTALATPPVPPPMLYKAMSAQDAVAYNASLPFTAEPNVPAKPFRLDPRSADYSRSLDCLTAAAYYEAAGEGAAGEAAVAQVVLNRVRHPAFPASICAVVFQGSTRPTGCQFTFTCDGSLLRSPDKEGWKAASRVAAAALSGSVFAPVGLATHYHANSVVPYWAGTLAKNAQVGAHIFYRWPGTWGRLAAFRQHYGGEPWQEAQLRNAALIAHGRAPDIDAGPAVAVAVSADSSQQDPLSVIKLLAASAPSPAGLKEETAAVLAYRDFADAHPDASLATVSALLSGSYGAPKALGVDQLAAAMKDFAASPAYAAIVKQRSTADRKRFADALLSTLRDLQAYSGVPIGSLAATLPASLPQCASVRIVAPAKRGRSRGGPSAEWGQDPLGARLGQAAADYLLWAQSQGDAPAATMTGAACSSSVDQQLVAAMLSRIIALRDGEAAGQRQVAWEVHRGHDLVPLLAQRLRVFEASRDRFVTLSSAYEPLVAGLSVTPLKGPAIPIAQSAPAAGQTDPLAPLADSPAKTGS